MKMRRRIAPDKWRHFFAGILMGAFLEVLLCWLWPANRGVVTAIVFVIVIVVSYGFELFSKITGKGHYDFMDAVASIIGGVVGLAASLAIIMLLP